MPDEDIYVERPDSSRSRKTRPSWVGSHPWRTGAAFCSSRHMTRDSCSVCQGVSLQGRTLSVHLPEAPIDNGGLTVVRRVSVCHLQAVHLAQHEATAPNLASLGSQHR